MNSIFSMRRLLAIGIGLPLLGTLSACGDLKADTTALTARTDNPAVGPDCASCHAYPLTDLNHKFHLMGEAVGNKDLNGEITCLDCHSQSIQFSAITFFDSIYEDTTGEKWRTLAHPNPLDTTSGGRVIRSMDFVGVDTLPQHRPIPMPYRSGSVAKFQEYMTSLAHMNGKVDVVFDSRDSDPARFAGQLASFNPTQETCSAVACHPSEKPYSFGSVAKGLPVLKNDEGENP